MTMTVRQLIATLNFLPQDMMVDTGSITITSENTIRFVDVDLEETVDEAPAWDADFVRDEIADIIDTHDDDVVDSILNWFGENVYAENMSLMIEMVRGSANTRDAAHILLDEIDEAWLSYLDAHVDEIFAAAGMMDEDCIA